MTDEYYNRLLKQFHKFSQRHILAVETDIHYSDVLKVVSLSDKIRKAGNETDGTLAQRDWYSSYLLYCYNCKTQGIDKDKYIAEFNRCHDKEKALIEWIKTNKFKILNSGIKTA